MPAINLYTLGKDGESQGSSRGKKEIFSLEEHPLVSRYRHRSSSAINGFDDDHARLAHMKSTENDVFLSDDGEAEGSKSSTVDQGSSKTDINSLEKSCNQCGMVWPKKRSSYNNSHSHSTDGKQGIYSNGCIKNKLSIAEDEQHGPKDSNNVKLRVSFFEKKKTDEPVMHPIRQVKSMSSLLEESQPAYSGEVPTQSESKPVPTVLTKRIPVVSPMISAVESPKSKPRSSAMASPKDITIKTTESIAVERPKNETVVLPKNCHEEMRKDIPKASGCPFSGKRELRNVRLKNYVNGGQQNDTLHMKSTETHCTGTRCMGSLMQPYGGGDNRKYGEPRSREEVKEQAVLFLNEFFASLRKQDAGAQQDRLNAVFREIDERGTYDLTYDELVFGSKLAWRNAARCIGRIQWNNLKVFDGRSLTTAQEMFDAICEHLDYATNGGNLRSTITVFRERREGMKDVRLWNSQLIKYAGYEQKDGSIIGDPSGVEFTKLCMKLGWKGPGGRFDVLPLIIEGNGEPPRVFDIPKHLVLEVKIKHPEYPWFEELGLQWYALPAVANMKMDVGGVEFPFAPFNGWYMVTEVGARDLGDSARYNMLEPIAKKMNLDTRSPASLWKDRAVTELNQAVLYSFQEAKVTLVDHHTASDSFITHMKNEQKLRGGCPADWVWIVPPSNGSTTEVFHQEMLNYVIKPSYDYQDDAWRHYQFEDEIDVKKITFKQAAILVKTAKVLMNSIMTKREKATVLYATETGKSEGFARILASMLSCAFDVNIYCMNEYEFSKLENENLLMIVTSTFGNGEAPMNGEEFGDMLYKRGLQNKRSSEEREEEIESGTLDRLKYAIFGLGSSAYPNFCAFAHSCRNVLKSLGGKEIHPIGEGDELCGQEDSFKKWVKTAFKAACDEFSIDQSKLSANSEQDIDSERKAYDPKDYWYESDESKPMLEIVPGLSNLHKKEVRSAKVLSVEELQSKGSSRSTVLVKLSKDGNSSLFFEPGDHLAIFPSNEAEMVEKIINRLHDAPHPDSQIKIQMLKGEETVETLQRLPAHFTIRQALTNFLDITSPPSQEMLKIFVELATDEDDRKKIEILSENTKAYEDWKYDNYPTISDTLEDFPSLKLNGLELLTQLPILQSRYYSISSSPLMHPDEIHATVAVVRYETQGDSPRIHNGVCSYWMSQLKEGDVVPCYIRQATSFRLPKENDAPVIMIGPGTGIAPLRSFWQQRQKQRDLEEEKIVEWGSMDLYTGCRRFKEDNIYMEEKQQALNDGTLDHAYLALSRERNLKKTYVQDMLAKHAKDVCDKLTKQNGHIYVCGDVAMAADVNKVLCDIFQNQLKLSKEKAREFLKGLKSSGHYHEDIFGVTKIRSRVSQEQK